MAQLGKLQDGSHSVPQKRVRKWRPNWTNGRSGKKNCSFQGPTTFSFTGGKLNCKKRQSSIGTHYVFLTGGENGSFSQIPFVQFDDEHTMVQTKVFKLTVPINLNQAPFPYPLPWVCVSIFQPVYITKPSPYTFQS